MLVFVRKSLHIYQLFKSYVTTLTDKRRGHVKNKKQKRLGTNNKCLKGRNFLLYYLPGSILFNFGAIQQLKLLHVGRRMYVHSKQEVPTVFLYVVYDHNPAATFLIRLVL